MTYYSEKPKNDKVKNDYPYYDEAKERGGCLSVFMAVISIMSVLNIPLTLLSFTQIGTLAELADSPYYIGPDIGLLTAVTVIGLVVAVAQLYFIYSLWNWKSIGYNGMLGVYIINIILMFILGTPAAAGGAAIGLGVLYFLMKDKMHYLD